MMSSSLSDVDDQLAGTNACFYYIPSKHEDNQLQHNSNPESNFYVVKNMQHSSLISSRIINVS
ncbi:unnamed protein product, partial [Rotaria magnacalcarata]